MDNSRLLHRANILTAATTNEKWLPCLTDYWSDVYMSEQKKKNVHSTYRFFALPVIEIRTVSCQISVDIFLNSWRGEITFILLKTYFRFAQRPACSGKSSNFYILGSFHLSSIGYMKAQKREDRSAETKSDITSLFVELHREKKQMQSDKLFSCFVKVVSPLRDKKHFVPLIVFLFVELNGLHVSVTRIINNSQRCM